MSGKITAKLDYENILNPPTMIQNPVVEHIIPAQNATVDLGNAEYKFRHLYLSDNSLSIGDVRLSSLNTKKQDININDFVKKDYTSGLDETSEMTMRLSKSKGKNVEVLILNAGNTLNEGMIIKNKIGKGKATITSIVHNLNQVESSDVKVICDIQEEFDLITGDLNNVENDIPQQMWKLLHTDDNQISNYVNVGKRWRIRESDNGQLIFEQNTNTLSEPVWTVQGEPLGESFATVPDKIVVQLNHDENGIGNVDINLLGESDLAGLVTITKDPLFGELIINDGVVTYQLNGLPVGIAIWPPIDLSHDKFYYTITTNDEVSNEGVVVVKFNRVVQNYPPIVKDLEINMTNDKIEGILLYGRDKNFNKLEYQIVDPPDIGTLTQLNMYYTREFLPFGVGKVGYIPDKTITNEYTTTFTYKAYLKHEPSIESNIGTVTITVKPSGTTTTAQNIAILQNITDYNQPNTYQPVNDPNAVAWCVPCAFASLLGYWNSSKNLYAIQPSFGGLGWKDYLYNPNRIHDLGYYFNTNNIGFTPTSPHQGTYLYDFRNFPRFLKQELNINRHFYYGYRGLNTYFGYTPNGRLITSPYNSEIDAFKAILHELKNNRPVVLSFSHWNIVYDPTTESFKFGDFIQTDDNVNEVWNNETGDFGLGHTVICVGAMTAANHQSGKNRVIVYDNVHTTPKEINVPFENWVQSAFLNIQ